VQVVDGQISDFKPYEPHAGSGASAHLKPVENAASAGA
jgi:hypothetical protein